MKRRTVLMVVLAAAVMASAPARAGLVEVLYEHADMLGWVLDWPSAGATSVWVDDTTRAGWLTLHMTDVGGTSPTPNENSNNPILYRVGLGIPDGTTSYDLITRIDPVNGGGRKGGICIFDARNHKIQLAQQDGYWANYAVWKDNGAATGIYYDYPGGASGNDYLKLHVQGSVLSFFDGPDGVTWTQRGSDLDMATVAGGGTWFTGGSNSTLMLGITTMAWDNAFTNDRRIDVDFIKLAYVPIPEPSLFLLVGTGLLGLLAARRRK
jgi:hypothetical protein